MRLALWLAWLTTWRHFSGSNPPGERTQTEPEGTVELKIQRLESREPGLPIQEGRLPKTICRERRLSPSEIWRILSSLCWVLIWARMRRNFPRQEIEPMKKQHKLINSCSSQRAENGSCSHQPKRKIHCYTWVLSTVLRQLSL